MVLLLWLNFLQKLLAHLHCHLLLRGLLNEVSSVQRQV